MSAWIRHDGFRKQRGLSYQRGLTSVEFALIAALFFIVLFACVEFARLLFTWNMLDEATRRGARLAVVCPSTAAAQNFVRNEAVFNGDFIPNLDPSDVLVEYLEPDGITAAANDNDTLYVRVSIDNYAHTLLIPMFDLSLTAPDFATTLPRESLGSHPDGTTPACI
jgi:Flp pilus assembly protein TadG